MTQPPNPRATPDSANADRAARRLRQGRRIVLGLVAFKAVLVLLAAIVVPAAAPYPTSATGQAAAVELYLFVFGYSLIVLLPAYFLGRRGKLIGLCIALLVVPDVLAVLFVVNNL